MVEAVSTDVVVIGAGLAGLQCAVTIKERRPQAAVVVIESQHAAGGSARWAVGSFTAGGTRWQRFAGVDDSAEDHLADALAMCPVRHPAYAQLLAWACRRGPGLLDDLAARGVRFRGPYPEEPHSKPRMHNAVPDASAVAAVLAARAAELGVTILTSCAVDDISRSSDRSGRAAHTGLDAGGTASAVDSTDRDEDNARDASGTPRAVDNTGHDGDGTLAVHADGRAFAAGRVVVASGDASAADPVFRSVNPGATGAAQRVLAARLGAQLEESRRVPWLRTTAPGPRVSPVPALVRDATVRVAGRELPGAELLANPRLGTQPLHLVIRADEAASTATVACTYPASGYATLADLVAAGLGWREDAGTVVLGPLVMAITLVDGGLVVDERLRVLAAGGTPVPGVHACGSAALGGISLGGHGHHLLWAAATGERAGAQVAAGLA
jgi:fumarate reductase flavoprotein subunit